MDDPRDRVLDIAVSVNSATSLRALIQVVMSRVGELIPYDRSSIALFDEDSDSLVLRELTVSSPEQEAPGDRGKTIPMNDGNVLGWVFRNGKPHLQASPPQAGGRFENQQGGQPVQSHIVAPLTGRERTLGVLNIGSFTPHAFREQDVATFVGYARLTAVAIENLRLYEQARESSIRDGLTGAHNHSHFKTVLHQEVDRFERYGTEFSLLLLDIDRFKSFNDRFGHQAGDGILMQTVRLLHDHLRPSDLVFRYGGEEFAILLPSTQAKAAEEVAEKLLAALRSHNTFQRDRATALRITASIGIATCPGDAVGAEGLLACADQALYRAKDAGRDRAVAFPTISEVRKIEQELTRNGGMVPQGLFDLSHSDALPECRNRNVIRLADLLALDLGLAPEQRTNLRIAAYYHDIGEAGLPQELFRRPGPIDARERTLLRSHPAVGECLLGRILQIGEVLMAVLHQHERFDGSGFPHRLRAHGIPLLARAVAVAVVFDALTSERPYRRAFPLREAYDLLRDAGGYHLDPDLVDRLIRVHRAGTPGAREGL